MHHSKGSILTITVGFALVFTMLGTASIYMSTLQSERQEKQILSHKAFWLAEAGIQRALWDLNHDYWTGWSGTPGTKNISDRLPSVGGYNISVTGVGTPDAIITATGYVIANVQRTVRIQVRRFTLKYALFANGAITLSNNARVDSYNSANGVYGGTNIGSNGDIGTNGTAAGIVKIMNNANVHGDVSTGPGGTVTLANNSTVSGSITHSNNITLPQVVVPTNLQALPSSGVLNLANNNTQTIVAGNYKYSSININNNAQLIITGTVNIYLTDAISSLSAGNNSVFKISPSATLAIYANGDVDLSNNVLVNQSRIPQNCVIYSSYSGNMVISNNSNFQGVVYAPNADIALINNGNIYGTMVGNTLNISNNSGVHYDENLSNFNLNTGPLLYYIAQWQEI